MENLPFKGDLRFGVGITLMLIASFQKNRSCKANTILSIFIIWVTFGLINTIYYTTTVLINLILLWSLGLNQYYFTLINFLNLYAYKAYGKILDPRISGSFDISGIIIILVIKIGYIAQSFDRNIENTLDYIFFIPGLVTGPIMPYLTFISRDKSVKASFPAIEMLKTLGFLAGYLLGKACPFLTYSLDQKYSFVYRMLFLYAFNITARCKFHFAWNFGHCCFILQNFPDFLNIEFSKVEFLENVDEITKGWNKFVGLWLKTLFFNPLKKKSLLLALVVSYTTSAVLHGLNLGYLTFFFSIAIYRAAVMRANLLIKNRILRKVQCILFIMYFSMPFYLLDIPRLFEVWKSVYFYGHIYFTFWLVIYWGERLIGKNPVEDEAKKFKLLKESSLTNEINTKMETKAKVE